LDDSQLAQTVEAWFYPKTVITDALVIGVEIGEQGNIGPGAVREFDVDVSASLSSVVQPVAADSVDYHEDSASVYAVLDAYDEPVSAAEWTAGGGRVTVEISEDTRSLHVTIVGSQDRLRAPYYLSGVLPWGESYSSLRVIGTGVAYTREKYVLPVNETATTEVGADADNEFLDSWGAAHRSLIPTAARYGAPLKRVSGALGGLPFASAGARLYDDYSEYRIRTVDDTSIEGQYQAEADTTHEDVEAVWAGFTVEDWDAVWAGRPESEFALWPLTPLGVVVTPPDSGYGSGVYGGPPTYGG
jgi:hypothetical protein